MITTNLHSFVSYWIPRICHSHTRALQYGKHPQYTTSITVGMLHLFPRGKKKTFSVFFCRQIFSLPPFFRRLFFRVRTVHPYLPSFPLGEASIQCVTPHQFQHIYFSYNIRVLNVSRLSPFQTSSYLPQR